MVSLEEGGVWQEWIARDRTANAPGRGPPTGVIFHFCWWMNDHLLSESKTARNQW